MFGINSMRGFSDFMHGGGDVGKYEEKRKAEVAVSQSGRIPLSIRSSPRQLVSLGIKYIFTWPYE